MIGFPFKKLKKLPLQLYFFKFKRLIDSKRLFILQNPDACRVMPIADKVKKKGEL